MTDASKGYSTHDYGPTKGYVDAQNWCPFCQGACQSPSGPPLLQCAQCRRQMRLEQVFTWTTDGEGKRYCLGCSYEHRLLRYTSEDEGGNSTL